MTFRAILVAAVSTTTQAAEEKFSIPQQLRDCRAVCEARSWQVVGVVVIPGHSRAYNWLDELVADCAEYAALLRAIRSDTIDLVVVRDYDRLWRTDALRAQFMAVCREHRVQVFSINQPVEPLPPERLSARASSHLIIEAVSGVISQIENETRAARARVGIEHRIRRGLHGGWVTMPYGYARGTPITPNECATWVRWIFEQRSRGSGLYVIARRLNDMGVPGPRGGLWTYGTIWHILHNSVYIGNVRWGPFEGQGAHEPIIDRALWERVRALDGRGSAWDFGRAVRPLSGLAVCGFCGMRMSYVANHHRPGAALRCNRYARTGGLDCQCNQHNARQVEAFVLDAVRAVLDDPESFLAARWTQSQENMPDVAALDAEIGKQQAAYARWNALYESGGITADELLLHRQRIQGTINALRAQRAQADEAQRVRAEMMRAFSDLATALSQIENLAPADLRALYGRLIRRVVLRRGAPPAIEWL